MLRNICNNGEFGCAKQVKDIQDFKFSSAVGIYFLKINN